MSTGARWAYASAFIVLLGVIGESVADLTNWIGDKSLKKRVEKASALILILGLAGDLVSIGIGQRELTSVIKQAGDAKTSADGAADAAKRANDSALQAFNLAHGVKDEADAIGREQRSIAKSQAETAKAQSAFQADLETVTTRLEDRRLDGNTLVKLLEGKPKKRVKILYDPYDAEAWNLSHQISRFLGEGPSKDEPRAGWTVLPLTIITPDSDPDKRFATELSRSGLFFIAKDLFRISDTNSALGALNSALLQSIFPHGISKSSQGKNDPSLPDDLIEVVVGSKPTWWWEFEALKSTPPNKKHAKKLHSRLTLCK